MNTNIGIKEIRNTALIYDMLLKKNKFIDEENTKNTLVLPLLAYLDYNIFSINDVFCEYEADVKRKRKTSKTEKVDYALMYSDNPKVFIEAKKYGEPLSSHIGQLKQYFASNIDVSYAILTNGNEYWFFSDYENKNIMDDKPYYKMKITDITDNDIRFIETFRRTNLIYL